MASKRSRPAAPTSKAVTSSKRVHTEVKLDKLPNYGVAVDPNGKPFPELTNTNLLRAAVGLPVDHVPIWLHRQAGRFLPEFRQTRLKHDFFTICRTPSLACEVTMQPLRRFDFDASIIFSDILVVPQAMGLEVQMVKGKGPVLPDPLVTPDDMSRLNKAEDIDVYKSLGYVFEAISLTRHTIGGKVPLIGFTGAPWTLMAYMVEGGGAKSYNRARSWFYKHPKQAHELLNRITLVIEDYLVGQVKAGAQLLEVFDSWAGDLSPDLFRQFTAPYLLRIATTVKSRLREQGIEPPPMTVFPKGAGNWLDLFANSDYDVVSLDWTTQPAHARELLQHKLSLQGNLDPAVLFADEDTIREEARKVVQSFGSSRYIFNLGHGMLPTHSPDAVAVLIDEVHKESKRLIAQL